MRYNLLRLTFAITVTLSAYPALAISGPYQNDLPPDCPFNNVDMCMFWSGDGTGTPPSDSACTNNRCLVCALDESRNREFCGWVTMTASCTCTIYKPEGSGPNITACTEGGQCNYVH